MHDFKYLIYSLFLVTSLMTPSLSLAHDWQVTLASQIGKDVFSRETSVTYTLPSNISMRLINDSYDDIGYGDEIRWGLGTGYTFPFLSMDITIGTGCSLAKSYFYENQFSLDGYLKIQYWKFFLELDNLFYSDGIYGSHVLAFTWPFPIGTTILEPMLGASTYLNTDYSRTQYDIYTFLGVRYAF